MLLKSAPALLPVLICLLVRSGHGKKSVELIFGGDVTFSGIIKYLVQKGECTYNESFSLLKPYLQGADFTIFNLETAIRTTEGGWLKPPEDKDIHLTSDPESVLALKYAGVSAVTLANNHANDLGAEGLIRTMQLLQKHDIGYFGYTFGKKLDAKQRASSVMRYCADRDDVARMLTSFIVNVRLQFKKWLPTGAFLFECSLMRFRICQAPLILEKNGIRIGVLGYCEGRLMVERVNYDDVGAAPFNVKTAIQDVKKLRKKKKVDIVIMFMHWSDEYVNVMGIELFTYIKQLVESVHVDVIVGSHPHVTQQHFYIGKTLIASSLGNLLFPSHYSCARNFVFEDRNVSNVEKYEGVWWEQSRILKNPTSYGRLIKVTVNKEGVVPEKTKYLDTQVLPGKDKPCLMVDKKEGAKVWRKICGKKDPECMATQTCNAIWCKGTLSYPDLIPPYSTKDSA